MNKSTKLNKRSLIAIAITLALAAAVSVRIISNRNVQVFDLQMRDAVLTPEWADNQHVSILRTEFLTKPIAGVGSSSSLIAVSVVKTLQVRGQDLVFSGNCCAEQECRGRWAAATAVGATEAVWWKQKGRWLPCFQCSGHGPVISNAMNRGPMLELPGAALGTLPDGRLVYTGTIMPATNNASIESWSPKGTGIQNLGQVHLPMSMQIFSARMSPNGNQICWLTYDINASDTAWESGNWFTRALRRFSGMPYPSISEVAWLSNVDGNNLHVVAGFQESGLLFNKYIQDYDEYIGPTGDEIAWSCDSQFFAFIRGNPSVKRQLYVCKAD